MKMSTVYLLHCIFFRQPRYFCNLRNTQGEQFELHFSPMKELGTGDTDPVPEDSVLVGTVGDPGGERLADLLDKKDSQLQQRESYWCWHHFLMFRAL